MTFHPGGPEVGQLPQPGPGSSPVDPPVTGSGYFSVIDGHELSVTELANSNMMIGSDGFVYQPVFGEGPFAGQVQGFALAPKWLQDQVLGIGDSGATGPSGATEPTAAELAIQRSQVQAQNLSTFISGTIAELDGQIAAGQLETEQALGEFNRRLDAFSEAGRQFEGLQPFTISPGSQFLPGREPGGIGEQIGRPVLEANPVFRDPFTEAADIVAGTPVLTDIGVPSGDALSEAVQLAQDFLGG